MSEVFDIMSAARQRLIETPVRPRLEGALRDLTPGEATAVAYYEATLTLLARKGVVQNADQYGAVFRGDL